MKRKLSAILAAAMLASSFGMSAMAEESVQARFTDYDQVNQAITVIAGTDTQKELGYLDGVTTILEVDGHKFKDLNGNGQLDVYEDWRQDVDARVKDLYDQMTLEERAGLFYHVNTCGSPMGVDFADLRYMFATESVVPDESSSFTSRSMWYYINVLNITSHLDNTNGTPAQQIVYHNAMQALAEDSRLGIPVVIFNDREYTAWGGMIDVAHRQFVRIASGPDKGKMMYTPLKNGKERTITLTVTPLNVLREAKRKQNEMHLRAGSSWHNEYNMIFTRSNGMFVRFKTLYVHFKAIVKQMGRPEVRFHDVRHTYATLSLQSHVDPKTLSEALGHATVAFTLDVYGHSNADMRQQAAEQLEQLICQY